MVCLEFIGGATAAPEASWQQQQQYGSQQQTSYPGYGETENWGQQAQAGKLCPLMT